MPIPQNGRGKGPGAKPGWKLEKQWGGQRSLEGEGLVMDRECREVSRARLCQVTKVRVMSLGNTNPGHGDKRRMYSDFLCCSRMWPYAYLPPLWTPSFSKL